LTYLVPCHLLTNHTLPSRKLLEPYPRLQKLFLPLAQHIRKGELHAFDLDLQQGEDEFVKRRIYLTLERGRDIALRNLLRKVFMAGGFEEPKSEEDKPVRRTRVPIAEFAAAISLGSQEAIDNDEVECLLANMIYKVSQLRIISQHQSVSGKSSSYCYLSLMLHCSLQGVKAATEASNSQCDGLGLALFTSEVIHTNDFLYRVL